MERDTIITKLFDTMQTMKRVMHGHMQNAMEGCPVSRAQLELLFTISHLQPVSFTQLAERLKLTTGAVSQLVDGLSQAGLVERETDPDDRRKQCLRLTSQGHALLHSFEKHRRTQLESIMQNLTTDELKTWLHIQEKMIEEFQMKSVHLNEKERHDSNKNTEA